MPNEATLLQWRARLASIFWRYGSGTRGLLLSGTAMGILYLLLTLAFPIWDWWNRVDDDLRTIPLSVAWAKPLLALFGVQHINASMAIIAVTIIIALFAAQALAVFAARTAPNSRQAQQIVIAFAIVFIAILIFMQPMASTDLYGYLARSYLLATLHQNPTISHALLLPGGFQVPNARPPAPYGPLWLLACWGIGAIAGENLLLAMLLMKLLMALATIGTILLVAHLADRLLPGQRVVALVFFAWSPLLLFEAIGNGHNDITMMLCVIGSLALLQARRPVLAFPVLALGVLLKYSVGVLVPLWAVFLFCTCCWRTDLPPLPRFAWPIPRAVWHSIGARIRWRRVLAIFGGGGALSAGIAVICYAPFWVGLKTFTGLGQQLGATYFSTSLSGILNITLSFIATPPGILTLVDSIIRLLLYLLFAAYLAYQTWRLAQRGSTATIVHLALAAGNTIFAVLLLITFWYQPWYIVWLLPLAALAPDGMLRRHAATLAFGGMLTYVVQYFMFVNQPDPVIGFMVQVCLAIAAFAPLLVLQHAGFGGTLRVRFQQSVRGLTNLVADRPLFVHRLMLGLILVIAALLRLIRLGSQAPSTSALHIIGGTLSVAVSDARGLDALFLVLQAASIHLFGATPFAFLLPTALLGTATVWLIAGLADEVFHELPLARREIVVLCAALLAATAPWHVALSRTGAEVTLLPVLIAGAALALLRARHTSHARRLFACAGVCFGLMGDLVVGLWSLVAACILIACVLWWQGRHRLKQTGYWIGYSAFLLSATVVGAPALWPPFARLIGVATGIPSLPGRALAHPLFAGHTSGRVSHTLWNMVQVVVTQNYTAVGPTVGGIPIVPDLLVPFGVIGVIVALWRWRMPSTMILALLAALPIGVALVVAVPTSEIIAASIFPIACLVAAVGMEAAGHWLTLLPVLVAGPFNRIFVSRQSLMRIAVLFLVFATTISTVCWYFANSIVGPTYFLFPHIVSVPLSTLHL